MEGSWTPDIFYDVSETFFLEDVEDVLPENVFLFPDLSIENGMPRYVGLEQRSGGADDRASKFDHTQDLPFFMLHHVPPSDYVLGNELHSMIDEGKKGCVVWAWREDYEQEDTTLRLSGYICSRVTHTDDVRGESVNCCFFLDDRWVASTFRLSSRQLRCCEEVNYFFRVLDKESFGRWIQVAVFKAQQLNRFVTPAVSLTASLSSPPKMSSLSVLMGNGSPRLALNSSFLLGDKIFGVELHKILKSKSGKVMVYADPEFDALLGEKGVLCSEIVHRKNVSNCQISFERAGSLRVVSVYATQTGKCCNKTLYSYQVGNM